MLVFHSADRAVLAVFASFWLLVAAPTAAALALNGWVGYFPTVLAAWDQLTSQPLPDQIDRLRITAMQLEGIGKGPRFGHVGRRQHGHDLEAAEVVRPPGHRAAPGID